MKIKTEKYGVISAPKKTLELLETILMHAENAYYNDNDSETNTAVRDYNWRMFETCTELWESIDEAL